MTTSVTPAAGTIDFTVPPELPELLGGVRAYLDARECFKLAMQGESTKAATGDLA